MNFWWSQLTINQLDYVDQWEPLRPWVGYMVKTQAFCFAWLLIKPYPIRPSNFSAKGIFFWWKVILDDVFFSVDFETHICPSPGISPNPAKYEPSGVAIATSCTNFGSFAISGAPIMIGTNQLPLEMEPTFRSDPLKEPDVRVAPHPAQHYELTIFVSVM